MKTPTKKNSGVILRKPPKKETVNITYKTNLKQFEKEVDEICNIIDRLEIKLEKLGVIIKINRT